MIREGVKMNATQVAAYGGGTMIRDACGRFAGVDRAGIVTGPNVRVRDGQVFRVTILPDAPIPRWCKSRPMGKCQHGKRGGYRHGNREKWAHRAKVLATATAEGF